MTRKGSTRAAAARRKSRGDTQSPLNSIPPMPPGGRQFGAWFDHAATSAACSFFPRFLRFTEGEWAGKPFELQPWQRDQVIRPLFG